MPTDPNTINLIWVFTAILLPIVPAFLLYKFLPSTGSVNGPFHGMEIKLGGAFAGYFVLVLVIFFWPRPKPSLVSEVWTLKGQIEEEDGTPIPPDKVNLSIKPPSVEYFSDGSFEMDILVKRGQAGQVKLPALSVDRQPIQPFGNATIHLSPTEQLFGKKYEIKPNENMREITIMEPIHLKKIAEKPYAPPNVPAPTPTVVPENANNGQ